jgi:hypothetical protein
LILPVLVRHLLFTVAVPWKKSGKNVKNEQRKRSRGEPKGEQKKQERESVKKTPHLSLRLTLHFF